MSTKSIAVEDLTPPCNYTGLIIWGGMAAALAALFVVANWTLVVSAALIIVALSAVENEPFLLSIIFLLPIGWFVKIDLPLGGKDARLDIATAVHLLVVGGFFLGRIWRGRLSLRQLLEPRLTRASLVLLAAALASVVVGVGGITYGSLKANVRLISYVAFYLFVLVWVNSRKRMRTVVITLLASAILVGAYGIIQEIVGDYTSLWLYLNPPEDWFLPMEHRVPSFLNYSNTLAGYLNLILPFALACCILEKSGVVKKLGAWTLGLGILALGFTQSRGGMVAFGCVLALAVVYFSKRWPQKVLLLFGLLLLGLGVSLLGNLLDPAHLSLNANEGFDIATRLLLWATALKLFFSAPLFGAGYGNFVELYASYLPFSWIPPGIFGVHNTYLQFLAETGLIGFTAFFYLLFQSVRQGVRQLLYPLDVMDKILAFGVLGAILTILIQGLVDFIFSVSPAFGTLFWTMLALLVVSARTVQPNARIGLTSAVS
jgi:putative inorganic carbon (hco3(-)) transporter